MMKFEEWKKIDFRIGEIKEIKENSIKINCVKDFFINFKLKVKKGAKIAVIINNDKLIIPVVASDVPLVPDKDIEVGSRVS